MGCITLDFTEHDDRELKDQMKINIAKEMLGKMIDFSALNEKFGALFKGMELNKPISLILPVGIKMESYTNIENNGYNIEVFSSVTIYPKNQDLKRYLNLAYGFEKANTPSPIGEALLVLFIIGCIAIVAPGATVVTSIVAFFVAILELLGIEDKGV